MADPIVKEQLGSEMLDLKQKFERVFRRMFRHDLYPAGVAETFFEVIPPIKTWVDTEDKRFHLTMPVPGMKPEEVKITLQGRNLTFTGDQNQEQENKEKNYLEREYSYGRFSRTATLPDGVDGEKVTAELKRGILEITAPIAAAAFPKQIPIKVVAPEKGDGK